MAETLQIIIPMAGRGERFAQAGQGAGQATIKALIEVDGRPMLEHVLEMFPGERDVLFICAKDHLQTTPLRKSLKKIAPYGTIAAIEPHRRGPLHSVLSARHLIHDERPVLLSYCDTVADWDYSAFLAYVQQTNCDACAPSHVGFHPHSLGPNVFGYLRAEGDKFREIRAKKRFQEDPMAELAAVGIYYFRTGALMKQYLEKTDKAGLAIDGEYFPSLALNVMAADGLDVRCFSVARFVQWETPEDLRVYERWANHFAKNADWRARLKISGTTLWPIAGVGERFTDAGFREPKPAVLADGEPMLVRAARSLPRTSQAIAVVSKEVEKWKGLEAALADPDRPLQKIVAAQATAGELATCLLAKGQVKAEDPLLIAPCDAAFVFDEKDFTKAISDASFDFVLWTFRDHPHANRNPQQYSWVTSERAGKIGRFSMHKALSTNPSQDQALSGVLWFRRAGDFFAAAEAVLAKGTKVDDEFLVEAVVPELLAKAAKGRVFPVGQFLSFGTPDELRCYAYWAAYFRRRTREDELKSA